MNPAHPVHPVHPARTGRGATPQRICELVAAAPNPTGHHKLTLRYRPLKYHTDAQRAVAEQFLLLYFEQVGGFLIADDSAVRAACTCLTDLAPEAQRLGVPAGDLLHWAIAAKAASLRGRDADETAKKRKFVATPLGFFGAQYQHWLLKSREYAAAAAAARAAPQRAQLAAQLAAHVAKLANILEPRTAELRAAWKVCPPADRQRFLTEARNDLCEVLGQRHGRVQQAIVAAWVIQPSSRPLLHKLAAALALRYATRPAAPGPVAAPREDVL